MTDTSSPPSAPPTDPVPPPTAPPGLPTGSDRFFSWVRGLGVVRADAWLGGVCGGLAARLRIDPIIVRGIFAVVALIGFPALLVYAIAWALLPDATGRIHLRELFRGRFDPAMVGILILTVLSFVPVVPWLWNAALWPFWAFSGGYPPALWDFGSPLGGLGAFLALGLIAVAAYFIVRSARSDRIPGATGSHTASADRVPAAGASSSEDAATAPPGGDADPAGRAPAGSPVGLEGGSDAAALASSAATSTQHDALTPPPAIGPQAPGPLADDAEIAQWRISHEAWREQSDSWRRSQQDAERAAREQARREREAAGAIFAAEAEERRRIRRATKPRTSFVYVLTALGAAIVTGAVTVLLALGDAATYPYAAAMGVLAAAIVSALSMVLAGAIRRRSGFLTAVTIVLLIIGLATAVASGPRSLVLGNLSLGTSTEPVSVTQTFANTDIWVSPLSEDENVRAGDIIVRKAGGDTFITVDPGTALDLEARLGGGGVSYTRVEKGTGDVLSEGVVYPADGPDGSAEWDWYVRSTASVTEPQTRQRIVLEQSAGSVYVTIYEKENS